MPLKHLLITVNTAEFSNDTCRPSVQKTVSPGAFMVESWTIIIFLVLWRYIWPCHVDLVVTESRSIQYNAQAGRHTAYKCHDIITLSWKESHSYCFSRRATQDKMRHSSHLWWSQSVQSNLTWERLHTRPGRAWPCTVKITRGANSLPLAALQTGKTLAEKKPGLKHTCTEIKFPLLPRWNLIQMYSFSRLIF